MTPHEKAEGRELVQILENPAVVGWYCSRTRGELALADADLSLYREFFPAQWQITLVLQAGLEGDARGAFFFAGKSGELKKGAERDLGVYAPGLAQSDAAELPPLELPSPVLAEDKADEKEEPPPALPKPGWAMGWLMSWILTAIAALAVGAAAFEVQNTWLTENPVQTPAPSQIP